MKKLEYANKSCHANWFCTKQSADTYIATLILNVSKMKTTFLIVVLNFFIINCSLVLSQSGNHFKIVSAYFD